ncbi:hypothetical protein B7463_g2266, partial [Scytalidium lignicola]
MAAFIKMGGIVTGTESLYSIPRPILLSTAAIIAILLYGTTVAFYRLYFHPLSRFPGPKLAAVTQWYEAYYELASDGGHFTRHIKQLHEIYGPIVRINPSEIHIDDPDYHKIVYTALQPYDKMKSWENRFNIPNSTFSTCDHHLHKLRRAAINPFFTTRKMQGHGPFMQTLVDKICVRFRKEYAGQDKAVSLNDVYGCLTADMITSLAFGRSYELLQKENWDSPLTKGMEALVYSGPWMTQLPWLVPAMNCIPEKVIKSLSPAFKPVLEFQSEMRAQIKDLLSGRNEGIKSSAHATVFDDILKSKLPPSELTEDRLQNEAVSIIGAGLETTKFALTVASYHILANPPVLERLRQELTRAISEPDKIPQWTELQQLPYLNACVQERTPVSLDTYHMHHNEEVFPDSYTFKPERWLDNPKGPDGQKQLSLYMTAFGKGTRQCLGMTMAIAEMYITLATLFRRFDFTLFETGRKDVDFYHDMTTPQVKPGSLGVRVTVKLVSPS